MTNLSIANRTDEDPDVFHARFGRCQRLLHFIACRVLGGPEGACDAVENCWQTASRNPPRFQSEGAFRSWLARVLMDEALIILRERQKHAKPVIRIQRNSFAARNQLRERRIVLPGAATEGEY
jgi:DNA-directed RNA polymerase specialized sigma24 family protein